MDQAAHPLRDIANPGIRAEGNLLRELRAEVAALLGRSSHGFPGAQPVSFSRKHLDELRREEYVTLSFSLLFPLFLFRLLPGLTWPPSPTAITSAKSPTASDISST
jgi:hypothetical protein